MTVSNRASQQELQDGAESPVLDSPEESENPAKENGSAVVATNRPDLHIDIQVHIDPTTSPELVDHIFASMAKHLYGLKP